MQSYWVNFEFNNIAAETSFKKWLAKNNAEECGNNNSAFFKFNGDIEDLKKELENIRSIDKQKIYIITKNKQNIISGSFMFGNRNIINSWTQYKTLPNEDDIG